MDDLLDIEDLVVEGDEAPAGGGLLPGGGGAAGRLPVTSINTAGIIVQRPLHSNVGFGCIRVASESGGGYTPRSFFN